MKILSILLRLLSWACSLHPAWAQSAGWTPDPAMRCVSRVGVSPDGKRVAFVVAQAVMEPKKVSGYRTSISRDPTEREYN
jgi:hypothetical protein